jgi:hypothetical protein
MAKKRLKKTAASFFGGTKLDENLTISKRIQTKKTFFTEDRSPKRADLILFFIQNRIG